MQAIVSEAASEILHKLGPIPNVCRDPNDDMIIACAVDAADDYIVTGDEDLLILRHLMISSSLITEILKPFLQTNRA